VKKGFGLSSLSSIFTLEKEQEMLLNKVRWKREKADGFIIN
jgi:hypothetical protein